MEKTALIIYLLIIVISPLLFGAVPTYAYTIMIIGILAATLLVVIKGIRKDSETGEYQIKVQINYIYFLFISILIFLAVQMIPLPDFILSLLSPEVLAVGRKSIPGATLSDRNWLSLSLYVYPVRMFAVLWITYGLFFWGLSEILCSKKRIDITVKIILMVGCFEALYGFMQASSGIYRIWWYNNVKDGENILGTYIGQNEFAQLMVMIFLLAIGYLGVFSDDLSKQKKAPIWGSKKLRNRIIRFSSGIKQYSKRNAIKYAAIITGTGIILSKSRGGIIAAAISMLIMGILFLFKQNYRGKGRIILILSLFISIFGLYTGNDNNITQTTNSASLEVERYSYIQKINYVLKDYRFAGIGIGNFQYAFPEHKQKTYLVNFMDKDHNNWIKFLAEGGIAGLTLFFIGILYFLYNVIKIWTNRKDSLAVYMGALLFTVLTAAAVNAYLNFNFFIPANFLILTAIVAIGYSSIHVRIDNRRKYILYRYKVIPLKYKGGIIFCMILGTIFLTGFLTVKHFVAEAYCNTAPDVTLNFDKHPPIDKITSAILWDSSNAVYWAKLAESLIKLRDEKQNHADKISGQEKDWEKIQVEIIKALEKARGLNAMDESYLKQLKNEYAYLEKNKDYNKKQVPVKPELNTVLNSDKEISTQTENKPPLLNNEKVLDKENEKQENQVVKMDKDLKLKYKISFSYIFISN